MLLAWPRGCETVGVARWAPTGPSPPFAFCDLRRAELHKTNEAALKSTPSVGSLGSANVAWLPLAYWGPSCIGKPTTF